MDLRELGDNHFQKYYLFNPKEYGRICVFVDFANVRQWAKCFWPDENKNHLEREVDIEKISTIIKHISPNRMYFYYGHHKKEYPELEDRDEKNLKYRQSIYRIDKARKCGFRARTKAVKEISTFDVEGKYLGKMSKCNFDVEMTMDMIQQMENYDTLFLLSGDSDFDIVLQYVKSKKKKIITLCVRDFVSKELEQHSDLFIPADPLKEHLEYLRVANTNPPKR